MKERSRGTPLIDMLKGYQPCRGRFHMPGHKASPDFCRTFPGAAWDITELPFSDDLLDEKGCIAEAEELAADPMVRKVYLGQHFELKKSHQLTQQMKNRKGQQAQQAGEETETQE